MHRIATAVLLYLLCAADGARLLQSAEGMLGGEASRALAEQKQSQIEEGRRVSTPPKALALLLLAAGRTAEGLQFSASPTGRHISKKARMEPMKQVGKHSGNTSSATRFRMVPASMQSSAVEFDTNVSLIPVTVPYVDTNPAVQGSGWVVKQWSSVQEADFEKMLDRLKSDMTRVFRREPDWDRFAEDFRLIEPSGDVVQGLGPIKMTLALVRKFRNRVAIKENVDVQFFYSGERVIKGPLVKKVVEARWKIKLGLELLNAPSDSVIDAETTIHFNSNNRVDYIKVNKWVVSGDLLAPIQPLQSWTGMKESDERALYLKRMRVWATGLKAMNEEVVAGSGPEAAGVLITSAADLAATFISAEVQYLATTTLNAALLGGLSDAISQIIDGALLDVSHVGAMTLSAGLLSGLFNTLWLQELEREVPGSGTAAVLTKTVADYVIAGTLFNSVYLVAVPLLDAAIEGVPPGAEHLLDGWTLEKFISAMRLEISTFTPYNLLAFKVVPLKYRPLASALVSALNTVVLSGITRAGG